jgi:hypothetical protein
MLHRSAKSKPLELSVLYFLEERKWLKKVRVLMTLGQKTDETEVSIIVSWNRIDCCFLNISAIGCAVGQVKFW